MDTMEYNKENGYVFEDVAALTGVADADEQYHHYGDDEDEDDYAEEGTTATSSTDFIVDNFRIANEAFRRSSAAAGGKGTGSVMTSTSSNIISQYSVKNTRSNKQNTNYQIKNKTNRISSSSNQSSKSGGNRKSGSSSVKTKTSSLEEQYTNAMSQMSRNGDYYFERVQHQQRSSHGSSKSGSGRPPIQPRDSVENYGSGRTSSGSQKTNTTNTSSKSSTSQRKSKKFVHPPRPLPAHKLPASDRDPSEEVIAVFGVHGVTGYHFLRLALEAGYKQIRCLVLPGMTEQGFAEDFGGADNLPPNLRLIVGTLDDTDKVQRVVKSASYVVCLFHEAERIVEQQEGTANNMSSSAVGSTSSSKQLPSLHTYYDRSQQRESTGSSNSNESEGSSSSNANYPHLKFMETLVPLLQDSAKCRVLLYQASSASVDERGSAPIIGQVVKKLQFSKVKRQQLKEQDRIVKYIAGTTREMPFNFVVTRPGDLVWDRPSRKKLSASKSLPGPFPITHVDLAEFTLGMLRNERFYNTCPYVVQDGI